MSRLPVADEKTSPELAATYAHITKTRGHVSNILKSFSNAPEGLKRLTEFGEYVRYHGDFPHRTRELVILTIARGNQYAWTHHYPNAIEAGVTDEEMDAINVGEPVKTVSAAEKIAMQYVREFCNRGNVSDATFAELKQHYSARQITDLTLLAGYYLTLGSTINAFRIELEPHYTPKMKPVV
jgi:alkylhydroperoxidase family enzyme